jgi:hypothetical protein
MVRAEDLRLGNIVYGVSDRLEKIIAINNETTVTTSLLKLDTPFEHYVGDLSPVFLDEEILLKCGFVKERNQNGRNRFELGFYVIYLETQHTKPSFHFKAMPDYFPELTEIKYLHQLQNLYFSLTNSELVIKL